MNPEKLSFCPISALLIKLQFFLWFFSGCHINRNRVIYHFFRLMIFCNKIINLILVKNSFYFIFTESYFETQIAPHLSNTPAQAGRPGSGRTILRLSCPP